MPVVLIARWSGDVESLKKAYDQAHRVILEKGGAPGELRHHCAFDDGALYIVGVWNSEEAVRTRFASKEFETTLTAVGFPLPQGGGHHDPAALRDRASSMRDV